MKRILTLMLAAAMTLGATSGAQAIDFKASGEWLMGLAAGDASLVQKKDDGKRTDTNDVFGAGQRVRLQLDAVASEALSGTVFFEIGDQLWGNGESGAAMGADGQVVKVKNAYLDWIVPNTDLQIRMGLQAIAMPDAAGGSAVMDGDVAGIVASYKFNDNVALTATWMRPFNDNYAADENDPKRQVNFLDNIDLFALSLPLSFDGVEVTPWVMYGIQGRNARYNLHGWYQADGDFAQTLGNTYITNQSRSFSARLPDSLTPNYNAGSSHQVDSTMEPIFPAAFLGKLPNCEAIVQVSAGYIYKTRCPILVKRIPS